MTLVNLPSHASLSFSRLITLRPTTIPIRAYLPPIALFFLTNALNNLAFSYRISVPVHIILRSGGSVTTMIVGYLIGGKRYTRLQILAVGMITIGVVIAAFADARSKVSSLSLPFSTIFAFSQCPSGGPPGATAWSFISRLPYTPRNPAHLAYS